MTRPDDSLHPQTSNTIHGGLTIREHFASLAMASMAPYQNDPAKAADAAVRMADALILRLNSDPAKDPLADKADDADFIDLR